MEKTLSGAEKRESELDRAEIGGRIRIEGIYQQKKGQKPSEATLSSGSGAEIYLDAKSVDNVRTLIRARVEQSATTANADSTNENNANRTNISIDEAKIQTTLGESLFISAGRQKMKFGAAKFFNPTDFPNQLLRDPFARDDRRPGVDALKLHLPFASTNLYAIALPPQNQIAGDSAAFGRAEWAFSGGEISISTLTKRHQTNKFGADASFAIADLDVYLEVASDTHERYSSGFTWDFKVSDSDILTLGAEYHRNGNKLLKKSDYQAALLLKTHFPLQLGRDYCAISAYLPKPKWSRNLTLLLSSIANVNDNSAVVVPQAFYQLTPTVTSSLQVLYSLGDLDGEFRMNKRRAQTTVALEAIF